MLREVINKTPVEIFVHVAETMALLGQHEHVEALTGTDEGIDDAQGVAGVYVVVDVTMDEHEVTLQAAGNLWIGGDAIRECRVVLLHFLLDAMMRLAPPTVVDAVVVVAGAGNCHLVEVRVGKYGRSGHETSAGVSVDADT